MKALHILCMALVAGGATGLFMPGGPMAPSSATGDPATGTPEALAMNATDLPGWNDQLALPRSDDGHFYADVYVDGLPYQMLVDTGASMVALTGADAEAMGLGWDPAAVRAIAQGASGPVYGVATEIPTMRVGDHEARDVSAMIIPEGLAISLLGQSFLATVDKVEISGDTMILGDDL